MSFFKILSWGHDDMTLNFFKNCEVLLFTFRFLVYLVIFVLLFNEVEISKLSYCINPL